jgi:hypothetical protein
LIQGPWDRIRLLDAKWPETPRPEDFSKLEGVAGLLRRDAGITRTEAALVSRGTTSQRLGERRSLVSAFGLEAYLQE